MNRKDYLIKLEKILCNSYNIKNNFQFKEIEFDFYAEYNELNERYFLTKDVVIHRSENNEFIFLKFVEEFNWEEILKTIDVLVAGAEELINFEKEHMSSKLHLLVVGEEEIKNELYKEVRKYKKHKNFMLGFKGWLDVGVIIKDLNNNLCINNKVSEVIAKIF